MKCPIDGVDLVMSERQGVEIDYCPTCRGIWLDRGELDKILDRAAAESVPAAPPAPVVPPLTPGSSGGTAYGQPAYPPSDYPGSPDPRGPQDYPTPSGQPYGGYPSEPYREGRDGYRDGYRDDRRQGYDPRRDPRNRPYRKKKESWLSDILDFD